LKFCSPRAHEQKSVVGPVAFWDRTVHTLNLERLSHAMVSVCFFV
jgi:hypothetical protein